MMIELGSEMVLDVTADEDERVPPGSVIVLSTAELAECTCPEFCERDHDVD
jgi:hypothetical protein